MVLSGLILKYPYRALWHLLRLAGRLRKVAFYVESEHDYMVIRYLLPHIQHNYTVVARSRALAEKLAKATIKASVWPVFPEIVIMPRHAFHKFPIEEIVKIGLRHGPYHFKKMISPEKYNQFDLFLFTSEHEASLAAELGIECGASGGYPRLDAFRDPDVIKKSHELKKMHGISDSKETLLFTATWDKSGLSAVRKWADRLPELVSDFNVVVSLHPAMSKKYINQISTAKVIIAHPSELPAWMLNADFLVGDTSSVIAEFCSLDKPIITFSVDGGLRLTEEISSMINDISVQINTFGELRGAIEQYRDDPSLKTGKRAKWNNLIFDSTDISHGEKAAKVINNYLTGLNSHRDR